MARNYSWRIKREYYNQINSGAKTLEVRVGYPDIRRVMQGDTITFRDYSNTKFEVVRVTRYPDFPEMLDNEDSTKAIPGVNKYKALGMYQAIYPEDKEALGVYVFELKKLKAAENPVKDGNSQRKVEGEIKTYLLSATMENHALFGKLAKMAYDVTDFICHDYPRHFEWYWSKEIPRVFKGTAEVVICAIDGKIAGVAFLKKEESEKKICTILVAQEYRGKHVATHLLEQSFKYLETTKPLITIADYKLPMFEHVIKKYDWEQTEVMEKGYYNDDSCEVVFNGKLSH